MPVNITWPSETDRQPVVLSWGLGVDSTAVLVRWITDPTSRDFELEDLVVVLSELGSEFAESHDLCEKFVLPLLRAHRIRFVEVARADKAMNFAVLQDTREPVKFNRGGVFRLADEMFASGTVPQTTGGHLCSIKNKAEVIDRWLRDAMPGARRHAIGYSEEERKRSSKDLLERHVKGELAGDLAPYAIAIGYSSEEIARIEKANTERAQRGQVAAFYPLQQWGWTRDVSVDFLRSEFGVTWPRSACTFCPFSCGGAEVLERFRRFPHEAVEGLEMEFTARALNALAGKLYNRKSLIEKLRADGNLAALRALEQKLETAEFALYRVRRQWLKPKSKKAKPGSLVVNRSLEIITTGTRERVLEDLELLARARGLEVEVEDGLISRVYLVRRADEKFAGMREEILAVAPAHAEAKAPRFDEQAWKDAADAEQVAS